MNRNIAIVSLGGVTTFNSNVVITFKDGVEKHFMDAYSVCWKDYFSIRQTGYPWGTDDTYYDYNDILSISRSGGHTVHVAAEDKDKELNKNGKLVIK